ncbi:hypothetical protein [Micromonospora lupini]|uniref:hypothetical protein n=1 Tax=Micromonospora lupini TaxID=285679 RepID=UPI0011819459|nr:hypothetical protein [Micromonospora lupini]
MTTQAPPAERVHAWPRALVVAALLAATFLAGWQYQTGGDTVAFRVAWIPVGLTVVPLFFRRARQFAYASLVVGLVVLALALQGVFTWILPGALILLATTADPRRSAWRARLSVLVGTALAVVAAVASAGAVHHSLTSPPVGFAVHTDAASTPSAVDRISSRADAEVASRVYSFRINYAVDGEGPTGIVEFTPGLSAQEQERLRRDLAALPGVTRVCTWYRDNHLRSTC